MGGIYSMEDAMLQTGDDFIKEYVHVWDDGVERDAPFIVLGVEALLTGYYGNLLDAPPPFPVEKGTRALDLGCGWGRVLKPVTDRGVQVIGFDISEKMLGRASAHLSKHGHRPILVRGDGTLLPFKDNSFDMVYSLLVLQHLSKENGLLVLREISRVLKPGGIAHIRVPGRFAPENLLFAFLQSISINIFRYRDPIRMRFYRMGEIRRKCGPLFGSTSVTAHEFRPPWNFHTPWTWHRIIIPKRLHPWLRRVSDKIEGWANGRFGFLKHFGVVLMIHAVK